MSGSGGSIEVSLGRQGWLALEQPETIKQRLHSCFARVPADRRLVDELPADHRLEAQRKEAWRQVVLQIQALR